MLIDLHVHTTRGSADSSLDPYELVAEAARLGIDGVCITEHSGGWTDTELRETEGDSGVTLFAGREIETDFGHVLAIGLPRLEAGMHRFAGLAGYAQANGAALVLAHPFRHFTDPPPGQSCLIMQRFDEPPDAEGLAMALPQLAQVHAIEAVNGATSPEDNWMAARVSLALGAATTGGSDAHSAHGIGAGLTEVAGTPRTNAELAQAIRTAAVSAAAGVRGALT